MALSTFASTRVLYQQNFETATSVEETKWTFGGASISIASDNFGKFLELNQGQTNGRSAQLTWGPEIFLDADGNSVLADGVEPGTYNVKYDFSIKQGSNNQYNGAFTVFTNHAPVANQPYRNPWNPAGWWENYLFDMSQVNAEPTSYVVNAPGIETDGTWAIDYSDPTSFEAGQWYTVDLNVNTNTREVEYSVTSLAGDILASDTRTVPEADVNGDPISMYAEGIFIMVARYATIIDIDNIMVSYESEKDVATPPTIALTRVGQTADEQLNLNLRAYTITFMDGETLHVTGTDGSIEEAEYADCDGAYVYETTASGTLKAYTTFGEATSETVEIAVDCTPIVLPSVVATISSVSEGFGKTYTLTVDNSDVPLRPTIFIDYEYIDENGNKIAKEGEASGTKVTVNGKGVLKVTSLAYGYQSKSESIENDLQFATKRTYDFARMTQDEIKAAGFPSFETLNSSATSGFNNWTARKRLFYEVAGSEHENEEGTMVRDTAYPFGFIAEDNTVNVINYAVINRTDVADTATGEMFEGLTIFPDKGKLAEGSLPNIGMMYRIGLFNDQTNNTNNNIIVRDLEATDFVVVNYINNYGGNSVHPVVATDAEYFAQLGGEDAVYAAQEETVTEGEGDSAVEVGTGVYSVTHALYRVDTACTKITVFALVSGGDAVEGIEATEVAGDNWYYTIDGLRLAEPTRPGLYIHNGKKIIVK